MLKTVNGKSGVKTMPLDILSYEMGKENGYNKGYIDGTGNIVIDGTNMTVTDDGEGNLTMTVTEE